MLESDVDILHRWLYHLFKSLQNGKNVNNDDLKSHFIKFFADEGQQFYLQGIMKLQEKWKIFDRLKFIVCIKQNELYFKLKKRNYFLANLIFSVRKKIHREIVNV